MMDEEDGACDEMAALTATSPDCDCTSDLEEGRMSVRTLISFGGLALLFLAIYDGGLAIGMGISQRMSGGVRDDVAPPNAGHRLFKHHYDVSIREDTYQRIWGGSRLPNWARKVQALRDVSPLEGKEMCFVHVGKTAGSSIGCALGFNLHCEDDQGNEDHEQYQPGRLPRSVTHAFHKDVYDCPSSIKTYLFVVRDPLARIRSAFVYGRPALEMYGIGKHWQYKKPLYVDCPFETISDLASLGLAESGMCSEECKQRARNLLRGTELYEDHSFYNYQYYLESIPHNAPILVIRTEHMVEDWNGIELDLGGMARSNITFPHDNSKPKEARDLILTDDDRMLLCHELCVEIQHYKLILKKATNIDEAQYETSMKELQASCPREANLKQCEAHTPNIKKKIMEERGYPRRS